MASQEGATPIVRESKFSMDDTPMSEVYVNIAQSISEETVLFTHVTNPFCGSETYARCLDSYMNDADFDSLTTVSDVKEFLDWNGVAVNFDPSKKPRSQDLPNIVKLNHAVSVLPREMIIEQKNIIGKNPKFLLLSQIESIDIDTNFDFEISKIIEKHWKI
jgi:N-acylneuraminate cytidylyltransferase